jgi:cyclically-permuted mutarotase family protein
MKLTIAYFLIVTGAAMVCCAPANQISLMDWKIGSALPPVDNMPAIGVAGPVTGVHRHMLIVGGGANFPDSMPWLGGKKKYQHAVYIFAQAPDQSIVHHKTCFFPFNIAYSASVSTDEGVIFVGGENENGISNKAGSIQWDHQRDTIEYNALPDLPQAITNAAATVHDHSIFVVGGETERGPSDHFYRLDLNNKQAGWQALPAAPKKVSHAVLLVQFKQGKPFIYLAGGRKKTNNGISELYNSLYEYDLYRQAWTERKPLPYALSAGTGLSAAEKYLIFFGGDKGETFHKSEMINAAIAKEQDEVKREQLAREKIHIQSTHTGFSNEILVYNVLSDHWSVAGHIPFQTPVTTTAVIWNDLVTIPSGEIKAGVRTKQILVAAFVFKD